jgi:uncharacterized protein (TIGR02597 family)
MRLANSILLLTAGFLSAQEVTSDPIGFNKVTCLANSDTIVGVPLRKEGSLQTKLSGAPTPTGTEGVMTLPVTATFTLGQFPQHYVKFVGGTKDGFWYDITSHDTTSITIDLNGDTLTGVASGNSILIAEYWTLDTLFDPAIATTDPTTTGHAIVASSSTSPRNRRTQVLIPNFLEPDGINQAPSKICYISGGQWLAADSSPNAGNTTLFPDIYIIVRHPPAITTSTVFRSLGEVETKNFTISLTTNISGSQDSYIGLPRPIDLRLNELNLVESGAFVASSSTSPRNRKDQILVFNNTEQLVNKAPSAIYYYMGGNWLNALDTNAISNTNIIPAGSGFLIRKAKTDTGATSMWLNTFTYQP